MCYIKYITKTTVLVR